MNEKTETHAVFQLDERQVNAFEADRLRFLVSLIQSSHAMRAS